MKEAAVLVVSRHVGGLERRFAGLFKYCEQNSLPYRLHFFVSRAQRQLMGTRHIFPQHDHVSLTEFGLPARCSRGPRMFQMVVRFVDYLLLIFVLHRTTRGKRFHAAHFVTPSSLFFRKLIAADTKITSVVNSNFFEQVSSSRVFRKALKEGFHVDNLSSNLRSQVFAMGLSDESRQHAAPCSFVDYEKTESGKKDPLVTFVSRFVPRKGLDILLAAVPKILIQCPKAKVMIIGRGPLEGTIRKALAGITGRERVWIGFHDEPVKVLKRSLIFLSLQERENYPSQSLLEAMACGNAVIATDVGLTRRLVDESVGLLIRHDSDRLVEAVCRLYKDMNGTIDKGRRARDRVVREHTVARFLEYLANIYFNDKMSR